MNSSCKSKGAIHVSKTMEKFYLCTHIPIKSVSPDKTISSSEGHNNHTDSLFQKHDILDLAYRAIDMKDSTDLGFLSIENLNFNVLHICPRSTEKGLYILGPYSPYPLETLEIPQKPLSCIPHIVELLRNIARDSDFIRKKILSNSNLYVNKALEIIESRYSDPISADSVSREFGISKCYFCSIFKKSTGKSFTEVLNKVRVEKSKKLLVDTNHSILDIALAVGYNNHSYYSMVFKKLNGVTPYEFKNSPM